MKKKEEIIEGAKRPCMSKAHEAKNRNCCKQTDICGVYKLVYSINNVSIYYIVGYEYIIVNMCTV